jgi:hypothetical protein
MSISQHKSLLQKLKGGYKVVTGLLPNSRPNPHHQSFFNEKSKSITFTDHGNISIVSSLINYIFINQWVCACRPLY